MRNLSVTWIAWYLCGAALLLAVAASLITIVPPNQWVGLFLSEVFLAMAVLVGTLAVFLSRKSPSHWLHQPQTLTIGLAVTAVLMTLLILVVI